MEVDGTTTCLVRGFHGHPSGPMSSTEPAFRGRPTTSQGSNNLSWRNIVRVFTIRSVRTIRMSFTTRKLFDCWSCAACAAGPSDPCGVDCVRRLRRCCAQTARPKGLGMFWRRHFGYIVSFVEWPMDAPSNDSTIKHLGQLSPSPKER